MLPALGRSSLLDSSEFSRKSNKIKLLVFASYSTCVGETFGFRVAYIKSK
jgi:hypothetical protein